MLGIPTVKVVNSLHVAGFTDPCLRKLLYPFFEKSVFDSIATGISSELKAELKSGWWIGMITKIGSLKGAYNFLKDNNFFGNPLLNLDNPAVCDNAVANFMIFLACFSLMAWDNADEMLTIAGILPIEFPNGERYLIVDNQNEDVFLTRMADTRRLFHWDSGTLEGVIKEYDMKKASIVWGIVSKALQESNRFIHRSKEEMEKFTPSAEEGDHMLKEDKVPTSEEMLAAIKALTGSFVKGIRGETILDGLIEDLAKYATEIGIMLNDKCIEECAKSRVLTYSVLSNFWKDNKQPLDEKLEQLLKIDRSLSTVEAFFDYAMKVSDLDAILVLAQQKHLFAEFISYCSKNKIHLSDKVFDNLCVEVEQDHISDISVILSYALEHKINIHDFRKNLGKISAKALKRYDPGHSPASLPLTLLPPLLCKYAITQGCEKIDLTEHVIKTLAYYFPGSLHFLKEFASVIVIDVDKCMGIAIEKGVAIGDIYSYAEENKIKLNKVEHTKQLLDSNNFWGVMLMFSPEITYEKADLDKCLEFFSKNLSKDPLIKIIEYAYQRKIELSKELVRKAYESIVLYLSEGEKKMWDGYNSTLFTKVHSFSKEETIAKLQADIDILEKSYTELKSCSDISRISVILNDVYLVVRWHQTYYEYSSNCYLEGFSLLERTEITKLLYEVEHANLLYASFLEAESKKEAIGTVEKIVGWVKKLRDTLSHDGVLNPEGYDFYLLPPFTELRHLSKEETITKLQTDIHILEAEYKELESCSDVFRNWNIWNDVCFRARWCHGYWEHSLGGDYKGFPPLERVEATKLLYEAERANLLSRSFLESESKKIRHHGESVKFPVDIREARETVNKIAAWARKLQDAL
jgi:hypothetical protein